MIRRALLSVSDKTGLAELIEGLIMHNEDIEFVSTGGTASWMRDLGYPVVDIASYTGFPEAFGGRLKTLHPKVLGGILFRRGRDEEEARRLEISPIDLVAVNLYPFADSFAQGVDESELVEQIDIGGVTLLRAAAKAAEHVVVLCCPRDYKVVLNELQESGGVSIQTRHRLRQTAFAHTAEYDAYVSAALSKEGFPPRVVLPCRRIEALRYGENPHQNAAAYRLPFHSGLARYQQLHGKGLSYTNLLDVAVGWRAAKDAVEAVGEGVACCIVKHAAPCGLAVDSSGLEAFLRAWDCDPQNAFGSILTFTRTVDLKLAEAVLDGRFVEVIVATAVTDEALERLRTRTNLRLIVIPGEQGASIPRAFKVCGVLEGGLVLLQTPDPGRYESISCPTGIVFPEDKLVLASFAMSAARNLKSNAIAIAAASDTGWFTVGLGGGQPARSDSVKLALKRALDRGVDLRECVLASDAFFSCYESLEMVAEHGIRYIIQPEVARLNQEVVEVCNRLGVSMLLTDRRHLRH